MGKQYFLLIYNNGQSYEDEEIVNMGITDDEEIAKDFINARNESLADDKRIYLEMTAKYDNYRKQYRFLRPWDCFTEEEYKMYSELMHRFAYDTNPVYSYTPITFISKGEMKNELK